MSVICCLSWVLDSLTLIQENSRRGDDSTYGASRCWSPIPVISYSSHHCLQSSCGGAIEDSRVNSAVVCYLQRPIPKPPCEASQRINCRKLQVGTWNTSSLPLEQSNFRLSEDTVKFRAPWKTMSEVFDMFNSNCVPVIHQMHFMAKFGYASLTLLTDMPLYKISLTT